MKCANFELETHFQALQNTVIPIFDVYISNIASNKNHLNKKQNYKQKKWAI